MCWVFPELRESDDEGIRKELLNYLRLKYENPNAIGYNYGKWIAWVEKKGEQKEIDYNEELRKCKANPLYFFDKYVKVKLKEQKSAWSEEDERIIEDASKYLREYASQVQGVYSKRYVESIADRIESLRPQTTWKPSDRQMDAVRIAAEIGTANDSWAMGVLKSMYQDLRKLREE